MKVYEMYNLYQKFCWQIYRQISQKSEMFMKKSSCKSFLRGTFFVSFRCSSESDKPSASIEERWSLIWEPTRRLRNSNKWKGTGYEKKSKE